MVSEANMSKKIFWPSAYSRVDYTESPTMYHNVKLDVIGEVLDPKNVSSTMLSQAWPFSLFQFPLPSQEFLVTEQGSLTPRRWQQWKKILLVPPESMWKENTNKTWFSACWSVQRGRPTDNNVRCDRWGTPSKCPVVQGEPDYRQVENNNKQ